MFTALFALSCGQPAPRAVAPPQVSVQRVRASVGGDRPMLSLGLLATTPDGEPVPCGDERLSIRVSWSSAGESGPWTALPEGSFTHLCTDSPKGDLALVVDNSGSVARHTEEIRRGAMVLGEAVLGAGGRASLVRVSTDAQLVLGLGEDAEALDAALGALQETRGWTALWDGIRMGNETFGPATSAADDLAGFCAQADRLGIVALTDGQENNSAGQQDYDHRAYPGDGIDTRFEDLLQLHTGGATTPIYTIGLGEEPDHLRLQSLALATGGRHLAVAAPEDLDDAYGLIRDYFTATERVCAALPDEACGRSWLKVAWTWEGEEGRSSGESVEALSVDCPVDTTGRTAVLLLTLDNPGIEEALGQRLARNAVAWASPVDDPRVLVVLDENHHDEFWWDADQIAGWLREGGLEVDRLDERNGGTELAAFDGYDVVWYSNPGYPMDDALSLASLLAFSASGGGLVVQGDDMGWSMGHAFDMQPLTHLRWEDNGTWFCGQPTDNNAGEAYQVALGEGPHPLLEGIEGSTFLYGDDIDTTVAEEAGEVLATATLDPAAAAGRECATVPVVLAWEP